jgi:TonB family protein
MKEAIERQWNNLQAETGWTEILFELGADGKLISSNLAASSGSFLLNQEALRAIRRATLPPLPRDFKEPTLRVRLRFNYGIK